MYITKVVLDKVRNFKGLPIEFEGQGEALLIAADNGEGKTTILRSIAMGLCDESSASGLLRELPGEFIRKGEKKATINIHLKNTDGACYEIETVIEKLPAFERLKQNLWKLRNGERKLPPLRAEDFPWNDIFVCGYGAGRQPQGTGTGDIDKYAPVHAVYSLFNYDDEMMNPELAMHRLLEKARKSAGKNAERREDRANKMLKHLTSTLQGLLNLDPNDRVIMTEKGIEVKGHWGRNKFSSIGDGYKATITWVMDLLSWRMLSRRWSITPERFSGIVLVDEIEQHLHPRWQINVMQLLRNAFPNLQFIATTHSPLAVSGCKECKVLSIIRGKYQVEKVYGWLAERVYGEVMDLPSSRPEEVRRMMDEFEELYYQELTDKISPADKVKLNKIENTLKGWRIDTEIITAKMQKLTKYLKQSREDIKE